MPDKKIILPRTGLTNPKPEQIKALQDKGIIFDENKLDELTGGPVEHSRSHQASYQGLDQSEMIEPYSDYVDNDKLISGEFDIDELNKLRAENQSVGEQATHAVGRLALNIVPSIVEGFATMVDIPGYFDAEAGATNSIVNAMESLKQATNENFAIYRQNPEQAMDFGDSAWWFENGEGLAESVGSFLAQGWGASKAISMGLKGLGGLVGAKKLVSFAGGAKNLKMISGGAETLTNAIVLNQAEATIDATQAYNETRQHWLDKGFDDEYAKNQAAMAASSVYNINRANILLNLTSSQAFFQPLKMTRKLLSAPGVKTSLKEMMKEGSQEALEEMINHAAGQAGRAHGRGESYGIDEAFNDMTSSRGIEAALLGAVGGIAQTGGQHIGNRFRKTTDEEGNKISLHQSELNRYAKQQEMIQSLTKEKAANLIDKLINTEKLMKEREVAAANGDEVKYKEIGDQMLEMAVFEHSQAGTMQVLEDMLRSSVAVDGAEDMGITPDKVNEVIKQVKQLEDIYNNHEDYANAFDIFKNRASKIRGEHAITQSKNELAIAKTKAEQKARELASDDKYTETRETKRKIIKKENGEEIVRRGRKEVSTQVEKIPLAYSFDNLSNNVNNNSNHETFVNDLVNTPQYANYINSKLLFDKDSENNRKLDEHYQHLISDKTQEQAKQKNQEYVDNKSHEDIITDTSKKDITELQNIVETSKNENTKRKAQEKINRIKNEEREAKQKEHDDNVFTKHAYDISTSTDVDILNVRKKEIINDPKLSDNVKHRLVNEIDTQIESLNVVGETTPKDAPTVAQETSIKATETVVNRPSDLPNNDTTELVDEINDINKQIIANKGIKAEVDEDGQINYDFVKVESGADKVGNLSRGYVQSEDNNTVTREDIDEINQASLNFANPKITHKGTEVVFIVDENYEGDVYNPESNEKEKISWKQRKAQIPQNELYMHIPIRIETKDGKFLGHIHSMDWISEENVSGDIDLDQAKLKTIRKAIMENHEKGKTTSTKLDDVSPGVLYTSKESVPVSKVLNDPKLPIGIFRNGRMQGINIPQTIENLGSLQNGRTYVVVPIGSKMYAIPLQNKLLSKTHIDSIITAVKIFRNGPITDVEKQLDAKYNLTDIQGLRSYLSKFVYLWNLQKDEHLGQTVKNAGLGSDNYAISIDAFGIVLGRGGTDTITKIKKTGAFDEDKLRTHLENTFFTTHGDSLSVNSENKSVLLLDENGNIRDTTYDTIVKETVHTDLRSYNVTPNESEPTYVYTIQPVVSFDTNFTQGVKEDVAETTQTTEETLVSEINDISSKHNEDQRILQYAKHSLEELQSELNAYEKKVFKTDEDTQMINDLKKAIDYKKTELPKDPISFEIGGEKIDFDFSAFEDTDDDSDDMLTPESEESMKKEIDKMSIPGISALEQLGLVSNISARVMKRIVENHDKGITGIENNRAASKDVMNSMLEFFKKAHELLVSKNHPSAYKYKNIILNYSTVSKLVEADLQLIASGKIDSYEDENDDNEMMEDDVIGSVENVAYQDDWALTLDSKVTASANLKRFLAGIKNRKLNENTGMYDNVLNTLSLEEMIPFDTVYNTLHKVLAGLPADYDYMIARLKNYSKNINWLQSVVEKLEESSDAIKNEFVSDMTKHGIRMRFIMWQKKDDGSYVLQDMNSNSTSIEEDIRDDWNSNLISDICPLTKIGKEDIHYDKDKVKELIEQANKWSNKNIPEPEELRTWLSELGIIMSNKGFKAIVDGKYTNKVQLPYNQLFSNTYSFVKVLNSKLKAINNTPGDVVVDMTNSFANDTAVKALMKVEAVYADNVFSTSFKAGPKSIYTYTNNKYAFDRFRELTTFDDAGNPDYKTLFDNLKQNPYSKESLYLKDLLENEEFRMNFGLDYVSLDAIKEMFKQSRDDNKLNNLSVEQHEVYKLAMFFNATKKFESKGEFRRKVTFMYPTMSDKTTMLLVNTLAYEMGMTQDGKLDNDSIKRLYDALVLPELTRIGAHGNLKNISGYNPSMFYIVPELNDNAELMDLVNKGKGTTQKATELIFDILQNHYKKLVDQKVEDLKELGIGETVPGETKYFAMNSSYMDTCRGDASKDIGANLGAEGGKFKNAIRDYIYNQLIYNAELHKLVIGDIAFFYKKPDKNLSEDSSALSKLQNTYINMGKRLAKEIAPGTALANSEKNSYYQVFMEDKNSNSKILFDEYSKKMKDILPKDVWEKYTQKNKINAADAQEYTTWQEHLYVLKQLGRLSKRQYDNIYGKIKQEQELEFDEIQMVFQPLKPVYTGNVYDAVNNVDRVVYIKSSSFPLLPQFTKGSELENVRQMLEALEDKVNKDEERQSDDRITVRASFNTANKVGAPSESLNIFDDEGNIKDASEMVLDGNHPAVLRLPRKNFRIQQDVPYKHDKHELNTGTQGRKLLFNNFLEIEGFEYNGQTMTGAQLKEEYDNHWHEIFKNQYEKFRKSMGLDEEVTEEFTIDELLQRKETPSKRRKKSNTVDEVDTIINSNFDSIIEQLIKARINVFFEEGEFKKCD